MLIFVTISGEVFRADYGKSIKLFDLNDDEKKGYSKMSGCVFTIKDIVRLVKPVAEKSQRMITFFFVRSSGMTWRTIDAAGSGFDSFFATCGIQAGHKDSGFCLYSIPARTALRLRSSAHSNSLSHYARHGQKALKHPQISSRISGSLCHQCTRTRAVTAVFPV